MKLNERLKRTEAKKGTASTLQAGEGKPAADPLFHLKQRAQEALFTKLGARLYDPSLSEEELQDFVSAALNEAMEGETAKLSADERQLLASQIRDDILGYGPVQMYLDDPSVTEIMVNAEHAIYVERDGKLIETNSRFVSRQHLRRVIDRIVAKVGRRIDESSPMVDARLPDGSRVNAIIPPLAVDGPVLTIRVFAKDPFQVEDLISMGTMTPLVAELLWGTVSGKLNIIVSGGTGTGKTTMLNVLSRFIPQEERIVTIEDAVELQLHQRHVIRLEARPPNVEGRGEITIRDLVRNALRMRPDRIVVGEARGGEALDMLQAMNTGHEGSMSTIHANSPRDTLARLETMVLMAGVDLPSRAIREQISSALDVIVHLTRMRDGSRRITQIAEVVGMEGDTITIQDIFAFDYSAGVDESGHSLGSTLPTGIRPQFVDRLHDIGIELAPEVFGVPDLAFATTGKRKK
ncbi:MAG: CpaF family protein [Gemmatimonadetes bacterium]|nr:CpaF family protein [Gemmatimonadota bacterium]